MVKKKNTARYAARLKTSKGIVGAGRLSEWFYPFTLGDVRTAAYNPNARLMAQMIQADWEKIGVKTKIVTYELGEYLKRANKGEHDALLVGWIGNSNDPDEWL